MSHTAAIASAPRDICQALTKGSRSNFYYAFLFLPPPQRQALYAVYAFCRVTDDLVDEASSPPSANITLVITVGGTTINCTLNLSNPAPSVCS